MRFSARKIFFETQLLWRTLSLCIDLGPDAVEIITRGMSLRDQTRVAVRHWAEQAYYLLGLRHQQIVAQIIAEGYYTHAQHKRAGYRMIDKRSKWFICKKDSDVDLTADFFANPWEDEAVFARLSPALQSKIREYESDYARIARHGETALYWMDVYHLEFHFAHSGSG